MDIDVNGMIVRLDLIASKGESYGQFRETQRWRTTFDGHDLGEVWRAERTFDAVVCWMAHSAVIDLVLPQSYVGSGYSRTSRKGAASDLLAWHLHRDGRMRMDGWTLHLRGNIGKRLNYAAIHDDGRFRWVNAEHNAEIKPHLGAMGGIGWQITTRRGNTTVIVHDASELEPALAVLLEHGGRAADENDLKDPRFSHAPCERHYPDASPAPGGP